MTDGVVGHCKLCELADFRDSGLRELIRDMQGATPDRPEFPDGAEHRKDWEVAMTARALRDHGALRDDAEILGVGSGQEATIFWLTRHAKRVFATDLYLTEDAWSPTDSGAEMLIEPGRGIDLDWNPRRLVVQHMDALSLRYEDDSFDGIFSSGSIEHFGELSDIRRSVEEMYRVLRPGGVAALATEFRLDGPPGMPGTHLFDESELRKVVLEGMDWELASPLDLSISEETLSSPIAWEDLFINDGPLRARLKALRARLGGPEPEPRKHLPTPYPHIVLRLDQHLWTSVHVALIKPL